MGKALTTRRAIMGAIGLAAPAAALAGTQAALPARTAAPSPELLDLIAAWKRADTEIDAFYAAEFNPAQDRHHAMIDASPHTEVSYLANAGPRTWSTANRLDVGLAKSIARMPNRHQNQSPEWQETRRRARGLYAAHLRRERAVARTWQSSGAAAACAKEDAMGAVMEAYADRIEAFPVASLAEMRTKLVFMARSQGEDRDMSIALIQRDIERLTAGGLN